MAQILSISILLFLLYLDVASLSKVGIKFDNPLGKTSGWVYHGQLFYGNTKVVINPQIKAIPIKNVSKTNRICGFYLNHDNSNGMPDQFPFELTMSPGNVKGASIAVISLKQGLSEEMVEVSKLIKKPIMFQIQAFDCDSPPNYSENKIVVVDIKSRLSPEFTRPSYTFVLLPSAFKQGAFVGEARAYESPPAIRTPEDIIAQGICHYTIVTEPAHPVPFSIDSVGKIHVNFSYTTTKQPILLKQYRFLVQATDCDTKVPRTISVPVVVDTFTPCQPKWTGFSNNSFVYSTNTKPKLLPLLYNGDYSQNTKAPLFLHVCSATCQHMEATVTATLTGENLKPASPEQCDLTKSESTERQVQLCGASKQLHLIAPAQLNKPMHFNGTQYLDLDKEPSKNANEAVFHDISTKNSRFHIVWWMKHGSMRQGAPKEQIICRSDSHRLSRHHTSLFLHNCKLILLLRHEHVTGQQHNAAKYPSEWRFGGDGKAFVEVCDGKWHHYALSVVIDNSGSSIIVELMVDGERFHGNKQELVDKELHGMALENVGTRTVVGACYHSRAANSPHPYVQFFRGQLAQLRINRDRLESPNAVRCMANCGETLLLPHVVEKIDKLSSVDLVSNSIKIKSKSLSSLLQILSTISYLDTNTPNKGANEFRVINLSTKIKCGNGDQVKIQSHYLAIDRKETSIKPKLPKPVEKNPIISIETKMAINGLPKKPVYFLSNVRLKSSVSRDVSSTIESCLIRPMTHTFVDQSEYLIWPVSKALEYNLSGLNNSHGLVIEGKANYRQYESLLRHVAYVCNDVKGVVRKLTVICSVSTNQVTPQKYVTVSITPLDRRTYYIVDESKRNGAGDNLTPIDKEEMQHLAGNEKLHRLETFDPDSSAKYRNSYPISFYVKLIGLSAFCFVAVAIIVTLLIYKYRQYRIGRNSRPHKFSKPSLFSRRHRRNRLSNNFNTDPIAPDMGASLDRCVINQYAHRVDVDQNPYLNITTNPLITEEQKLQQLLGTPQTNELIDDIPPSPCADRDDDFDHDDGTQFTDTPEQSPQPNIQPKLVLPEEYMEQYKTCTV